MKILCAIILLFLLSACAAVPKNQKQGIKTERELSNIRDERNTSLQKFIDMSTIESAKSLSLPEVMVADGVVSDKVTQLQADLVANRAGREICKDLLDYFEMRNDSSADLKLRVIVTAINPTSSGASGASAVIGAVVPGPFRLPIGLGGLAADASADDASGKQMLITKWAKGANSITNDAKVSRIGDAYQLAAGFAGAFSKMLINPGDDKKIKRPKLNETLVEKNKLLCEAKFGKASVAGRGASLLLPLAPEAFDSGPPKNTPVKFEAPTEPQIAPDTLQIPPVENENDNLAAPQPVLEKQANDSVDEASKLPLKIEQHRLNSN
jgi:Protein of unknown function (DUF3313)